MIIDPLGIVPIERGGTGATTLKEAQEKLGGGGTVLFSSESGTTDTTITLSDDISNYKYVEIYYQRVSGEYIQTDEINKPCYNPPITGSMTRDLSGHMGITKAIVKEDGKSNVCIETAICRYNQRFYSSTYYTYVSTHRGEQSIKMATLTGNTFIHDNITSAHWFETYSKREYSSGVRDEYKTDDNPDGYYLQEKSSSSNSNNGNYITIGNSNNPPIYAIVGYK